MSHHSKISSTEKVAIPPSIYLNCFERTPEIFLRIFFSGENSKARNYFSYQFSYVYSFLHIAVSICIEIFEKFIFCQQ
jgi:hypothetical protein